MSQLELIKNHLQKYGSISSWQAITDYHITRLGAHILTLRNAGMNIESHWESRDGKHWVNYKIVAILEKNGQMTMV